MALVVLALVMVALLGLNEAACPQGFSLTDARTLTCKDATTIKSARFTPNAGETCSLLVISSCADDKTLQATAVFTSLSEGDKIDFYDSKSVTNVAPSKTCSSKEAGCFFTSDSSVMVIQFTAGSSSGQREFEVTVSTYDIIGLIKGLAIGVIVAIVVGILLCIFCCVGIPIIVICCIKKKKKQQQTYGPPVTYQNQPAGVPPPASYPKA